MKAFANGNGNLTVLLGSIIYEFPMESPSKAHKLAARVAEDRDFSDVMQLACRASPRIGNRVELEARDDCVLRIWNGR